MFNPSSPVSGVNITGYLTSPTYTLVEDPGVADNARQYYVSALGGTQTNVAAHTLSKPFTVTFFKPEKLKPLGPVSPVTGVISQVPFNNWALITRKGAQPYSNQVDRTARIESKFVIPAGCESYEPEELAAMLALHIGTLTACKDQILDSIKAGTL